MEDNQKTTFIEEVVPPKKKRGRASQRAEKKQSILKTMDSRILREQLGSISLYKVYKAEMRTHQKMVEEAGRRGIYDIMMPEYLATMKSELKTAEENVKVARISRDAVRAFPPLT